MSGGGRRALVTGGAGFIGSHLTDGLVAAGWRVRVLDDFSSGREENLAEARGKVEIVRGDVGDPDALASVLRGVEVVFHQAAIPSVPRSLAEPVRTHGVNLDGTVRLLEAARAAGARRVVFASSSSVYGDTEQLPKRESMPPNPLSPYALQKYAGELYCRQYAALFGLETVALRYFNVFGPRQDPASDYAAVIPRFVTACLKGDAPRIHGDGEQTRDFTFVADAVQANLRAADATGAAGAVLNVATGRRTSIVQLLDAIRDLTGVEVTPTHEPAREGDVRHSVASIDRAGEVLGFRPAVDLREGLCATIASFDGLFPSKG